MREQAAGPVSAHLSGQQLDKVASSQHTGYQELCGEGRQGLGNGRSCKRALQERPVC